MLRQSTHSASLRTTSIKAFPGTPPSQKQVSQCRVFTSSNMHELLSFPNFLQFVDTNSMIGLENRSIATFLGSAQAEQPVSYVGVTQDADEEFWNRCRFKQSSSCQMWLGKARVPIEAVGMCIPWSTLQQGMRASKSFADQLCAS